MEIVYGLTSLSPKRGGTGSFEQCIRAYLHLEDRIQLRRDITLGEDACHVLTGYAPQVLADLDTGVCTFMDYIKSCNAVIQQNVFVT